jgi:hypothetical protein
LNSECLYPNPKHQTDLNSYLYDDDDQHGIPYLNLIDLMWDIGKNGHALGVVVSKPLDSCRRCQMRLGQKIENYLTHINSSEVKSMWGEPSPANFVIEVSLHKDCHAVTATNLLKMMPWAEGHGATLLVKNRLE